MQAVTGKPPHEDFLKKLFHRTQGNAFFLEETLQRTRRGPEQSEVADGVRVAVERSLESLGEPARDLLRIASVIGGEFDVPLLKASSTKSVDEVIAIVSEAETQGFIIRGPGAIHLYHFKHGLVAETLYQTLPKLEAMRLHLQIAQAIEGLYQGDLDSHFAQIAHHYNLSLPLGPADRVVHFCEQAALRARGSCAYEDATQLFRTALNAAELIRPADARMRLNILKQLGEVSFAAGLFGQSRDWFHKATQIARGLGDYEEVARLVLGFVATPSDSGTVDYARVRLLNEALGLLGENDNPLRARLMSRLAWEVYWSESSELVTSLTETAREVASRLQDNDTLIEVLYYRHHAVWRPDNLEERLAITRELIERCGSKYSIWAMRAHYLRIVDLLELGSLSGAREEIERYSSIARETGFSIGYGELARASCCLIEGKLDQGERWAERALQIGLRQELRGRRHREAHTFYMLSLRREQGRSQEMESVAQKLSAAARLPVVRAILAVYYVEVANLTKAKSELDRLVAGGLVKIRRDSLWLATMALGAQASVYLKDHDRSEQFYELLLPYADRNAILDVYVSYGPVTYYLGLLAAELGRIEESRKHFEKALEATERSGAFLFLAHTLSAYASTLLELKDETETANARRVIDRGLILASTLGLTATTSRLRSLEVTAAAETSSPFDRSVSEDGSKASECSFLRDRDGWTIAFGRKPSFRLSDSKGLGYLAVLVKNPAIQIHALDLVSGDASATFNNQSAMLAKMSEEQLAAAGMTRARGSDAGEMLDQQAKVQYVSRLRELSELLEEAKSRNDIEGASALEDEREMLMRELSRAVGLRGKDRRAASDSERARINVTRALKAAINRIVEREPELGLHLSKAVRTGTYCSYAPVLGAHFAWRF